MGEHKRGAAERRDGRAAKDEPVQRTGSARKDTRRWCKGKQGREHVLAVEPDPRWNGSCDPARTWWPCSHREVCTVCGKQVRWHLPVGECPVLGTAASAAATGNGPRSA